MLLALELMVVPFRSVFHLDSQVVDVVLLLTNVRHLLQGFHWSWRVDVARQCIPANTDLPKVEIVNFCCSCLGFHLVD
jgi:hypothetical protein